MDDVTYLLTCTERSRSQFILDKLGLAANLRKQIAHLLDEWVEAEAQAMLGSLLREHKLHIDSAPTHDILPVRSSTDTTPARPPARLS